MVHRTKINLILLFLIAILLGGCGIFKKSTKDKAMADERKQDQAYAKEMRKLEEAHYKNQPPDTKKMMKRTQRRSGKLNKRKRHSSLK